MGQAPVCTRRSRAEPPLQTLGRCAQVQPGYPVPCPRGLVPVGEEHEEDMQVKGMMELDQAYEEVLESPGHNSRSCWLLCGVCPWMRPSQDSGVADKLCAKNELVSSFDTGCTTSRKPYSSVHPQQSFVPGLHCLFVPATSKGPAPPQVSF
uniref:Uncharacterized protein n=1 Tax=Eutreptiella gymnastica TaxID=73025 RepID=A0A7S4LD21_9EUGL